MIQSTLLLQHSHLQYFILNSFSGSGGTVHSSRICYPSRTLSLLDFLLDDRLVQISHYKILIYHRPFANASFFRLLSFVIRALFGAPLSAFAFASS